MCCIFLCAFCLLPPPTQKDYMDSQAPVLELKDVPPPPRPAASQPFPLVPLPMPPPCLPARAPLAPAALQSGSPKVSSCSHCEASLHPQSSLDLEESQARGFGDVCGEGSTTIGGGGGSSVYLTKPLGATNSWSVCQAAPSSSSTSSSSSAVPHRLSLFSGPVGQVAPSLPLVATSQPMASLSQLPCCSGLLKPLHAPTCPQVSQAYGQQHGLGTCPGVAQPAPGYFRYGGELDSRMAGKCSSQHHHHHLLSGLSMSPAHVCSHPLHHYSVKPTVCLKGAHYCQDCLSKVGWTEFLSSVAFSEKVCSQGVCVAIVCKLVCFQVRINLESIFNCLHFAKF